MWTETINEMKLLGATRHWRNPVQWGFLLRNLDLIYEVLLCMWTDCSGDGFTLRGLLLLVLWVLTADCWVPLATFGVKLLKNAFKEHGTANMREVGASLGESLLLLIGGNIACIAVHKALRSLQEQSSCMRKRSCDEENLPGFLLFQELATNICGMEVETCFKWIVNLFWLFPFLVSFAINTYIAEPIWCDHPSVAEALVPRSPSPLPVPPRPSFTPAKDCVSPGSSYDAEHYLHELARRNVQRLSCEMERVVCEPCSQRIRAATSD